MAAFEYVAVDTGGKRMKGVISADSPRAARRELRLRELMPVEVSPLSAKSSRGVAGAGGRISEKDRALLARQLAVLLQSGLTVEQALTAAASDGTKPETVAILHRVRTEVTEGSRFADALSTAPRAFPPLFKSVVAAGEMSGRQGEVMERLAVYLENTWRLRQKVQSALIYPALLAALAIGMVVALMILVVPRLVEQFDMFNADLPWLTQQVIAFSNLLRNWGWLIAIGLFAGVIALTQVVRTPAVRDKLDRFILRVPIIGNLTRTVSAARFARIFATLSSSGATVLESLQAARGAMSNVVFRNAADEIGARVREGGSFAAALKATGAFPPMMVHMVASGEAGRDVPGMMTRAAEFLEEEFETATSTALSLMEPIIIVFLGGLVGTIVLSIMLPIIQLNSLALQ
ncbi:type II secretion system inner membrane protein GspF [Hyphomonas johnsonii]|uniref:General secretion pathway protein F n=1 Tax=Hyphomonas johnsonii MHS-2 TaxID=1280950 RepID=A0A059FUW4_9PROT|nr:type II secretion system inner membrane protein GspF [Hyphomonas johnsonii]KCZ94306.1 general secretion pathway protein F [Hyphomonas johnsonii MHS-2]